MGAEASVTKGFYSGSMITHGMVPADLCVYLRMKRWERRGPGGMVFSWIWLFGPCGSNTCIHLHTYTCMRTLSLLALLILGSLAEESTTTWGVVTGRSVLLFVFSLEACFPSLFAIFFQASLAISSHWRV